MFYLPYKIEEDIYRIVVGEFVKDITTMRDCKSKNSRGGLGIMCDAINELATKRIEAVRDEIEEKARKEGELKIIRKLHSNGMNAIQIASALDIPLEEVEKMLEV